MNAAAFVFLRVGYRELLGSWCHRAAAGNGGISLAASGSGAAAVPAAQCDASDLRGGM